MRKFQSLFQKTIEVRYEDENIWISQKMMAELYKELSEYSVIRNFRITANDGKSYSTKHYNLQMIIAVGFKVNNERAVQFRKWANSIVKDYTIQGWTMDDERLK